MSEKVVGQQFQGVTIGVSIPLWENKNTVKYANAKIMAMQSMQTDAVVQFYNERKALHAKVIRLQGAIADYRSKLNAFGNTALLQKALDKGEISLGEYFFELSFYYESFDKLLQMEYDLAKTIVITSYSIHYTKLYETKANSRLLFPKCWFLLTMKMPGRLPKRWLFRIQIRQFSLRNNRGRLIY